MEIAINGIISASQPHQQIRAIDGVHHVVISDGNPDAHLVMRGYNYPKYRSNYDEGSVSDAVEQLRAAHIDLGILIDCSHGNCGGDYRRQREVARTALAHIQRGLPVRGVLIESHLRGGRTSISDSTPDDVSITDPCLSWEHTEELIWEWVHTRCGVIEGDH